MELAQLGGNAIKRRYVRRVDAFEHGTLPDGLGIVQRQPHALPGPCHSAEVVVNKRLAIDGDIHRTALDVM